MVQCHRCGNQQHEPRAGVYPEEEFLETFHELMDAQAELKRLRARYSRLEWDRDWWIEQSDFWSNQAEAIINAWIAQSDPQTPPPLPAELPPLEEVESDPFS